MHGVPWMFISLLIYYVDGVPHVEVAAGVDWEVIVLIAPPVRVLLLVLRRQLVRHSRSILQHPEVGGLTVRVVVSPVRIRCGVPVAELPLRYDAYRIIQCRNRRAHRFVTLEVVVAVHISNGQLQSPLRVAHD